MKLDGWVALITGAGGHPADGAPQCGAQGSPRCKDPSWSGG
jgi:hypothetical protein